MLPEIEKLLYQRYILHSKKFKLLQKLDLKSYVRSVHTLNKIHLILNKEIYINKKLSQVFQQSSFPEAKKELVHGICTRLFQINIVLKKENAVLCRTNIFTYSYSYAQKIFTGKEGYFYKRFAAFQRLTNKELVLHQILFELSQKLSDSYKINERKVLSSWKLVVQLQEELRRLAFAIGDTALVKRHGEHVLLLIYKIKKTEIYEFVQQDVRYIQGKVEYVMAHPKEHKLVYFFTTFYIIAPFTFEMTGVILFFRYLGKYAISKTKKFKNRFSRV